MKKISLIVVICIILNGCAVQTYNGSRTIGDVTAYCGPENCSFYHKKFGSILTKRTKIDKK